MTSTRPHVITDESLGGTAIWQAPDGSWVQAPQVVTAEQELRSCRLNVVMRLSGGRYVPTELTFMARDPEAGVDAKDLRHPLNSLAKDVMRQVARPVVEVESQGVRMYVGWVDQRVDDETAHRLQTPRAGGRQRLDDDFLREVARVWTSSPKHNRGNSVRNWYRRTHGVTPPMPRVDNWRRAAQRRFPELFEGVSSR